MANFETKLRWLSERGNPVGVEELIERIEADLAGDPLVVVSKRREGKPMTKTQQSPTTEPRGRYRGPAVGVAAFAIILALVGIYYFTSSGDDNNVANTQPPPTSETMTGSFRYAAAPQEPGRDIAAVGVGVVHLAQHLLGPLALLVRADRPIPSEERRKLSLFCNVRPSAVIRIRQRPG